MQVVLLALPLLLTPLSPAQDFGPAVILGGGPNYPGDISAIDINGDGLMDVIGGSVYDDRYSSYLNLGGGAFGARVLLDATGEGGSHTVGDFNGTGSPEAWVQGSNGPWIFEAQGSALVPSAQFSSSYGPAVQTICLDVDADGDLDVVGAHGAQQALILWENQSSSNSWNWQSSVIATGLPVCRHVTAGDLNNDGVPDFAVPLEVADQIVVILSAGPGIWDPATTLPGTADRAMSTSVTDLDGDGHLDILFASFNDQKIGVYYGDGTGGFGPQQVLGTASGSHDVEAGDLDGDGDKDLVAAGWGGGYIRVLRNDGGGSFSTWANLTGGSTPNTVKLEDMDGDGDLDVLAASAHDDRFLVWENLTGPYDCNGNGQPDSDDISSGVSADCNNNGIPDECDQINGMDCDGNGTLDSCEIASGTAFDCNNNGLPDSCDVASGLLADCNLNGIADCNEFAMGSVSDCDANGIPDTCDIDGDPSLDLDGNGILDSCEATQVVWTQSPINGRYYTSLPPMTWAEAEAIAVSYGGHLATVRSQEENDWVAAFYGLDQAWIGLNDLATEGSFGWSSGESPLFTNWAPGSPGGFAPDQDFVAISGLDGNWNDWFAGTLYPGIVEVGGADCDDDTRPDDYEIATAPENDWNGDGILDVCVPPNYCEGAPNSATPDGGVMSISGSPLISDNDVELRATGLPGSQWSFFIMSRTQASVPGFGGSQGVLCLGAPQYRFNRSALGEIAQTTPLGVRSLALDLTNLPQGVVMLPGETWNFQLWYRDQNPGQTSNTTDGLEVLFR